MKTIDLFRERLMNIRTIISSVFVAGALVGCALTEMADEVGETLVDDVLKRDLINELNKTLPSKTSCKDRITLQSVRKTAISKPLNNGSWQEVWVVESCGKENSVAVDFSRSPSGGTDFRLSVY